MLSDMERHSFLCPSGHKWQTPARKVHPLPPCQRLKPPDMWRQQSSLSLLRRVWALMPLPSGWLSSWDWQLYCVFYIGLLPLDLRYCPADLSDASSFILSTGNFLSSKILIISLPTTPVAPAIATLYFDFFIILSS